MASDMLMKRRYNEYPSSIRARARRRENLKLLPGEPHAQGKKSPRGQMAIRTMLEVAKIMGITKARVHQLERKAFWKIRQHEKLKAIHEH